MAHPVSALAIMTFIAALAIIVALLVLFFRKRENRHPMDGERERNIQEIRRDGPST